jgi:hypothetical protein
MALADARFAGRNDVDHIVEERVTTQALELPADRWERDQTR